jgi:hypothetical protein
MNEKLLLKKFLHEKNNIKKVTLITI